MTTPRLPPTLLAISPGDLTAGGTNTGGAAFTRAASAAIEAGLRGILVREPGLADGALLELARVLARELDAVGGWLAIHDRVHLARAAGAAGVHVGFRSLTPRLARQVAGPELAIGYSSHAGDGPQQWEGADYLFHGPVHETASKAGRLEPVGYGGLGARASEGPPVWALGGLRPEHADEVLASGARGLAVLGGIFGGRGAASGATSGVTSYLAAIGEAAS